MHKYSPSQKYTWRESWVFPYESMWSLMHKFGFLNRISCMDIKKLFHANSEAEKFGFENKISKWSFHSCLGFDLKKISQLLSLDSGSIQHGITSTFIAESELHWVTSFKELRYCPECISMGYHSVFHQLWAIKECPIHKIELYYECFNCREEIPFEFQNRKGTYICPTCRTSLLSPRAIYNDQLFEPIFEFKAKFDELFEWFSSIKAKTVAYTDTWRWAEFNKIYSLIRYPSALVYWERASDFTFYWKDINEQYLIPELLKIDSEAVHSKLSLKRTIKKKADVLKKQSNQYAEDNFFPYRELRKVYNSIRRYILKKFKKNNIDCLFKEHPPKKERFLHDKYVCEIGDIFLCWHKYWVKALKGDKVLWVSSIFKYDLNDTALNRQIALKLFALECYWSFEERLFAEICHETGSRIPYWSITKDENQFSLHFWIKRSLLSDLQRKTCPLPLIKTKDQALVSS